MNKYYSIKPILNKKLPQLFIETYGCQMNLNDSEVVLSILQDTGYALCHNIEEADLILINTCSIRENAEQRVWGRLDVFRVQKKRKPSLLVGIIGCMAERLKEGLLEHPAVDLVAGPDAYRDLGNLVKSLKTEGKQINTILSIEETYADISPIRMDKNGVSAFISIMRGCNNMCSYCVVPYVRGRERSRDPKSILQEAEMLISNGYKEINLLGQNVDSYNWVNPLKSEEKINFTKLIEMVALINNQIRIRFSTSHPKDIEDSLLYTMAEYPNICSHIHLPVQSGNNRMLQKMNRKYSRETYLERISKIREIIPDCAITTDIIVGFCTETEEEHRDTVSIMKGVKYDSSFMFQYSMRPNTKAARDFQDDIPTETKTKRLNEIISLQNKLSLESNTNCIGKIFEVLIEGTSKKSDKELYGKTSQNKVCVFPASGKKIGELVNIRVISCTSATLLGEIA